MKFNKKIILFLMFGLSVWMIYQKKSALISQISSYAIYPVLRMQNYIADPIKIWFAHVREQHILAQLLEEGRAEIARLTEENSALHAQIAYMEDIDELRTFKNRYELSNAKIAHIMARYFSDHAHYLLIDAGSIHGIEEGMIAVLHNTILGKITKVYPWYSKVSTITDRSCKVAAYDRQTKTHGIHEGINQDMTVLSHVSHLSSISVGDLIISSGEGLVFPQGFVLGRVAAVYPDGLQKKVMVQPLCDMHKSSYCLVLPKGLGGLSQSEELP
jgi:rod shape-determining protein MreC